MSCSHSRLAGAHPLLPVFYCRRTALRIGETTSASGTECCNKRSTVEKGLAFKQGLVSSSAEVEEEQRVTVRLAVAAPISLPVPLTSAVPPQWPQMAKRRLLLAQYAALALLHSSEFANLPQITPSSQQRYEPIIPFPKSSSDEGYSSRPRKVISLSNTSKVEWHSPETKDSTLRTVAKPGGTQFSLLRLLSCEDGGEHVASCRTLWIGLNDATAASSTRTCVQVTISTCLRPRQHTRYLFHHLYVHCEYSARAIRVPSSLRKLLSCPVGWLFDDLHSKSFVTLDGNGSENCTTCCAAGPSICPVFRCCRTVLEARSC